MPPNSETVEPILDEQHKNVNSKPSSRKFKIAYTPVVTFTYIHLAALYGLYLCFTVAKWQTIVFGFFVYIAAQTGLTAGVHRLWSHRSFKAKMPLQIILMLLSTLAFQNTVIYWVRDHRQHHKYSDTDGDPHNARRGFFYSHIGWLLTRKSDEVMRCGKTIDMSDIYSNAVLRFQKKFAIPLITTVCFVLPTIIPFYCWDETLYTAWYLNMLRYAFNLNITCLINSAAHKWGYKPYDKNIKPGQLLSLNLMILGDGFHNYHHVFPWDYQSSELGNKKFNYTTWFIDLFAKIGWAYDLKTIPEDLVKKRIGRTGDGSDLWGNYGSAQDDRKKHHDDLVSD